MISLQYIVVGKQNAAQLFNQTGFEKSERDQAEQQLRYNNHKSFVKINWKLYHPNVLKRNMFLFRGNNKETLFLKLKNSRS